ncbi:hypothetical protein M441DRAFT_453714 [Trichoderma asperellum CBS 433.97]|uniref:O-methyltransferase domain-containing protein n=1 Tax=Trichoderma asperellum (strain ATCC 204424 / CBS 433.97 / NBRC 101777) TaxID=1042311 RepID=A0A2T3ZH52_TRIA4|nr:hypothetical protein M441DRAFT_453714 [Trichoderma asperellum CBS 433.97]PTB44131.1 hypothetical protein M441DRAFT_453714 [Trichoderma asperellum CBS 433.97]
MDSEMGLLADEITQQVAIWEKYGRESGLALPSAGFYTRTPVLSPQTPRYVLDAREKIIGSAFKLLQLAAGPSKIPSIAISYSQTLMALKWLFHFKIFDHVPEEPIEYDELAESANVPVLELKRMLRIVMASFIFFGARGWNGIPFFCDVVMPAAVKIVDATTRWPSSEDPDETARNIAQNNDLNLPQYLTESNQAEGYTSLMKLLGSEPSQQTVLSADIVHGFDWANLPRDSVVVDGPQDKLNVLKETLGTIEFFAHDFRDEQPTHSAAVYLLAGTLDNLPDDAVKEILVNIANAMSPVSYILIATSVLSEADDESLAVQRETRCRDLTMRQLQNTRARTISE